MRYEELPGRLRARVDAALARPDGDGAAKAKPSAGSADAKRGRGPNKTEAGYRAEVLALRDDVAEVRYEGVTFRMANGHRYTPDWVVVTRGGLVECHEVKGRYALHSQQRARLAFDQARVEFPWVIWVWAARGKDGWKIERGA